MIKVEIKFLPGTDIEQAAVSMMDMMNPKNFIFGGTGVKLEGDFNGIMLYAINGTTAKDIIDYYYKEMHRKEVEAVIRRQNLLTFHTFERTVYKDFFDKINADAQMSNSRINSLCAEVTDALHAEKKRLGVEV